ncbi:MAG: ATP-binding protein, partial [Acidimicrobiales bacterium]
MRRPAHRVTTAHLGAAHPFLAATESSEIGVYLGRDLFGGPFGYDPFELYSLGRLTDPNMVILGQIGRGKSSLVKSYLWRQAARGRRAWVVDPKGEYGSLAARWGTTPLRLSKGSPLRLNPLEVDPATEGSSAAALLAALAETSLGRPLLPRERAAADVALQEAALDGVPT